MTKTHASRVRHVPQPQRGLARADRARASAVIAAGRARTAPARADDPGGGAGVPRRRRPSRRTGRRSPRSTRPGPTGSSSRPRGRATRRRRCSRRPSAAIADGLPVVARRRAARPVPRATGYAFPGGGATWVRAGAIQAGHLGGPKARIALALGHRRRARPRRAGRPARRPAPIHDPERFWTIADAARHARHGGRIATLAGERGFGWVEAVGITTGASRSPGRRSSSRRGPTRTPAGSSWIPTRSRSPGLTDAHLHLAEGGARRSTGST